MKERSSRPNWPSTAKLASTKRFKGNVATVYTHPLSKGGASNGHYGGNAETYMNVGEAMGRAMVELLKADGAAYSKFEIGFVSLPLQAAIHSL